MLQLLLAAAIPFQRLIDKTSPTHAFINRQALSILRADARHRESAWLDQYLSEFNDGCDWADMDWRNVGHMYDPTTGRGFRGWPSATESARCHWDMAVDHCRDGNLSRAFFYLGAAAHLVQDLCVPHHAAARLFAGHKRFETYARRFRHRYATHHGGLYGMAATPEDWVVANAEYTRANFSGCVADRISRQEINAALTVLLPRAQRSTAGFVAFFLDQMEVA